MAQRATIQRISAVTLTTCDMARAVGFFRCLGFGIAYGSETADFTSLVAGSSHLNLRLREQSEPADWGRVIFYVSDVDAFYQQAVAAGLSPEFPPSDAPWGERYFHINSSPDGHPLSFAAPLSGSPQSGDGSSR